MMIMNLIKKKKEIYALELDYHKENDSKHELLF